jgi:hypothetical protein
MLVLRVMQRFHCFTISTDILKAFVRGINGLVSSVVKSGFLCFGWLVWHSYPHLQTLRWWIGGSGLVRRFHTTAVADSTPSLSWSPGSCGRSVTAGSSKPSQCHRMCSSRESSTRQMLGWVRASELCRSSWRGALR